MKHCVTCRHYEADEAFVQGCFSESAKNAAKMVLGDDSRATAINALIARSVPSLCGPEAKWWQGQS